MIETYKELKDYCEGSDRFKQLNKENIEKYNKEIKLAKRFYDEGENLFAKFLERPEEIQTNYIIPYLLGFTDKITNEEWDYVQIRPGASGGIDIDIDLSGEGKEKAFNYFKEKYGDDKVFSVGAYSRLGLSSAVKDLLRLYNVPFKDANKFTKKIDQELSWEDNVRTFKNEDLEAYEIYKKYKNVLDLVDNFVGKTRQCLPYYQNINTNKGLVNICDLDKQKHFIKFINKKGEIKETNNFNLINNGKKIVYEITTKKGKRIRATKEHLFFTTNGIKKLKDLKCDDELIYY